MDYSSTCMLPRKCQVLSKVHLKLLLHPSVRKPKLPRIPSMTICSFIHLSTHSLRMQLSKHRQAAVSPGTLQWQSKYSICPPGLWKKIRLGKTKNNNTLSKVPSLRYAVGAQSHLFTGKLGLYRGDNKLSCLKESPLAVYSLKKYIFIYLFILPPQNFTRGGKFQDRQEVNL